MMYLNGDSIEVKIHNGEYGIALMKILEIQQKHEELINDLQCRMNSVCNVLHKLDEFEVAKLVKKHEVGKISMSTGVS